MVPAAVGRFLAPIVLFISRVYFTILHYSFAIYGLFTTRNYVRPSNEELLRISATQAVALIGKREITSLDLVNAYIRRIEQVNDTINAMIVKNFEAARDEAQDADDHIASLDDDAITELLREKPLFGVPFTLKDALEVKGTIITCGIYNRKDTVCDKDALVVERMRAAGGILLGITNVPEVCMWVESHNTIYGRSKNPYDTRRMTGGSSGGEGALLSAAGSLVGIGSDIGGSIRMPSFFNGIFGMKTTPGIIPLSGHVPEPVGYKQKMLRIGPMCRFAEDIPLLIKIMGGDNVAALRLDEPVSMKKLKIYYMEGISDDPLVQPLSSDMRRTLRKSVGYFEKKYDLCAHRVDLPLVRHAIEFFFLSMEGIAGEPKLAELMLCTKGTKGKLNCLLELPYCLMGKSNHTLAGIISGILDERDMFTDEQRKELLYKRERLSREFRELLGSDGIFLFPSWPCTALFHNQPILAPMNFAYTCLFNSLAFPVVQCPMGLDGNGLPLGVQVVGAPNSDRLLIAAAKDLEEGFGGWVPAQPL